MSVQKNLKFEINSAGTILTVSRFSSTLRLSIGEENSSDPEAVIHIDIPDLMEVLTELEVIKDYHNE